MKKLFSLIVGVMFLGLLFISCQENTVNPVESNSDDLTLEKRGKVIEKVTGSGHFTTAQGDFRTFSFNVRKYADGSFEGSYARTRRIGGVTEHHQGDITCFIIEDKMAWFAGIETVGSWSTPPNNGSAWRVIDNGEGNNNPPDQISLQWVNIPPSDAEIYCQNKATAPAYLAGGPAYNEIEAGNIQIHK